MDYVFDTLLTLHLLSLGLVASSAIGMPIIMSRMRGATPDGAQMLRGIGARLGLNARIALGVLIITGPLMVWEHFGTFEGLGVWFQVKMALVAVVVVTAIVGAVSRGRINPRILGTITGLCLIGIVIAAVLTFN
jgi:hypothetical protein